MYLDDTIFEKIITANKNNLLVCTFSEVLWYTGARLIEALETTPKNILLNKSSILINNKRKRTRQYEYYREIGVPDNIIKDIVLYIENNEIKSDERIFDFTPKTGINYIRNAGIIAGIDEKITPKMFRYGFAQKQILSGLNDFQLNYLLGNTDMIIYKNIIKEKHIA